MHPSVMTSLNIMPELWGMWYVLTEPVSPFSWVVSLSRYFIGHLTWRHVTRGTYIPRTNPGPVLVKMWFRTVPLMGLSDNSLGRIGYFPLSTSVGITTFWHGRMAPGRLHLLGPVVGPVRYTTVAQTDRWSSVIWHMSIYTLFSFNCPEKIHSRLKVYNDKRARYRLNKLNRTNFSVHDSSWQQRDQPGRWKLQEE